MDAGTRMKLARQSLEGLSVGDAYGNHHGNNARKIQHAADLPDGVAPSAAAEVLGNGRPAISQQTVLFALWAAADNLTNFEQAILRTAGVGGDVDTNCAIVGGIVVLWTGVDGIPPNWLRRRETLPDWPFEQQRTGDEENT